MQQDDILFDRCGAGAAVLLNRPRSLNAITWDMAQRLKHQLLEWQHDSSVEFVWIRGAGDRAFCAGGDVKSVCLAGKNESPAEPNCVQTELFREEYELVHVISNYPKPYVAFLDGITMGTGVGLAIHGSHCIATERVRLAMPETAIGFIPDVGASYFFSRLGSFGTLLALTGITLPFPICTRLGWFTHCLPHGMASEWEARILAGDLEEALRGCESDPERLLSACENGDLGETFETYQQVASTCFAEELSAVQPRLQDLAAQAENVLASTAQICLHALSRRSPLSLRLSWELLRRGAELSLDECLQMEFRVCQNCMVHSEFFEGVRAVLVDKDQAPKWTFASIGEVSEATIQAHFEPLPAGRELVLGKGN